MIKIIFTGPLTNIDYDKRVQTYNINQFIQIPKIGEYISLPISNIQRKDCIVTNILHQPDYEYILIFVTVKMLSEL